MEIQYTRQQFQTDAAKSVTDAFIGQPGNSPLLLSRDAILQNVRKIQRANNLPVSKQLEGDGVNLTIEMETGVGKTYTYIKTMYELKRLYGWRRFIVVVPSIAIREGVCKTFRMTERHFMEEYGEAVNAFIYNSSKMEEIHDFVSSFGIQAMIINSQSFNVNNKDLRRIFTRPDEFGSLRPVEVIAGTRPIMIIDEPQSVEGRQTRENMKAFSPMMTLRYSATHRKDSIYNMVYRLDALDAYNRHLVKKIAVTGIRQMGSDASGGYVYLSSVDVSDNRDPVAVIEFDRLTSGGVRRVTRRAGHGFNLYDSSGGLGEYKDGYTVKMIDGRDNSLEFVNGLKIFAGDVAGDPNDEHIRRLQIRETLRAHFGRERALFRRGIKVLSLFFIDKVANYRGYDSSGHAVNGLYADIFEEEYRAELERVTSSCDDAEYVKYLEAIPPEKTHAGYFSSDKKGHMTDSRLSDRRAGISDDTQAYDLIMRNKERLLSLEEPVRFIFSHSALREGWDNPNVFQICALKHGGSDVRRRQEVGRGMRLCVDSSGRRVDAETPGVNVLTVIAGESYGTFCAGLQSEIAEAVADRPRSVSAGLFDGRTFTDASGHEFTIDTDTAERIRYELDRAGFTDYKGQLTEKYYASRSAGSFELPGELSGYSEAVAGILDGVYSDGAMMPEDTRSVNVNVRAKPEVLDSPEFRELWEKINPTSAYSVRFESSRLVKECISELNKSLNVPAIFFMVERGEMDTAASKDSLKSGGSFVMGSSELQAREHEEGHSSVRYDVVGRISGSTGLMRRTVTEILGGIDAGKFRQLSNNPEEFIIRASRIINDKKASIVIDGITYSPDGGHYDTGLFTAGNLTGRLGTNAMAVKKSVYDYVVYDSETERRFADELDKGCNTALFVKLPEGFTIPTPAGKYNPDWAISFLEGGARHIYFVAETKGSMNEGALRGTERAKTECARRHFESVCGEGVKYDVVDGYDALVGALMPQKN